MTERLCLVTGATGVIGPPLVDALVARGYRVRALVRTDARPPGFPPKVEIAVGEITDVVAIERAVKDAEIVFHLAAKLHLNDPDPALADEYRRVNVLGTRVLVTAARAAGVRRLVYFSSICVYGPGGASVEFDENSLTAPDTLYAESKVEAEKLVLAARRDDELPLGVVLRLAAVYGSHMKGNYPRLVEALRRGRFRHIGDGGNRRTLVHERDVVGAAILAAEHQAAAGRLFNVTDGSVHTIGEIVNAICDALKVRSPKFHLPERPVRLVAGVIEDVFRVAGRRAPLSRNTVNKLLEDVAVNGALIRSELAFRPEVDLAQGWREAVTSNLATKLH